MDSYNQESCDYAPGTYNLQGKKGKCFLEIEDWRQGEIDGEECYVYIICEYPYEHSLEMYYFNNNNCNQIELECALLDILDMYHSVIALECDIHLSLSDISLSQTRHPGLPYPQTCITPYAFIKAFFDKLQNKETHLFSPFASVLTYYNEQLKDFYDGIGIIDNAIEVLEMDENAVDCLLDCEILLELYQKMDIPQFDLESLTLIEKTSEGKFGKVMKVKDAEGNIFALKESKGPDVMNLHKESFILHHMSES